MLILDNDSKSLEYFLYPKLQSANNLKVVVVSNTEEKASYWLQRSPPLITKHLLMLPPKRRRSFLLGRACTYEALHMLGVCCSFEFLCQQPTLINKEHGLRAVLPNGYIGSISHSDAYAIAAVSSSIEFLGIGIDTEECVTSSVAMQIKSEIADSDELTICLDEGLDLVESVSLLFSLKESVLKALPTREQKKLSFKTIRLVYLNHDKAILQLNFSYLAVNNIDFIVYWQQFKKSFFTLCLLE